jgi:hypothetical protein
MRIVMLIIFSCCALWTGCTSSRDAVDSRESVDKYRPDWLPPTARIIFTSRWEDGFLGDGAIKVKARITEAEFATAVQHLELTPHTADRRYPNPPQWLGDRDARWDPPRDLTGAFVKFEGRWFQIATYDKGFLYYQSVRY